MTVSTEPQYKNVSSGIDARGNRVGFEICTVCGAEFHSMLEAKSGRHLKSSNGQSICKRDFNHCLGSSFPQFQPISSTDHSKS